MPHLQHLLHLYFFASFPPCSVLELSFKKGQKMPKTEGLRYHGQENRKPDTAQPHSVLMLLLLGPAACAECRVCAGACT